MGRRSLLALVREHLGSSRVVTLVGPGGVGKTRVAVRFAEVERRSYPDGCWVVPLADVAEPELLSLAVAEALGLQGADRPWRVDTLADYIADRTALLVLDNCEHLASPLSATSWQGLRAACPNVRFLLTSRRPLRLSGEDVIVVPPLSVPDEVTRGRAGSHHPLRGGQPVRGPRDLGTLRLPGDTGQCGSGRGLVPRPGGHAAGHRAGCCPGPGDVTGGDSRQPH